MHWTARMQRLAVSRTDEISRWCGHVKAILAQCSIALQRRLHVASEQSRAWHDQIPWAGTPSLTGFGSSALRLMIGIKCRQKGVPDNFSSIIPRAVPTLTLASVAMIQPGSIGEPSLLRDAILRCRDAWDPRRDTDTADSRRSDSTNHHAVHSARS